MVKADGVLVSLHVRMEGKNDVLIILIGQKRQHELMTSKLAVLKLPL